MFKSKKTVIILVIYTISVLISGSLIGVLVSQNEMGHKKRHHRSPERHEAMILKKMTRHLKLSPIQQEKMKIVIRKHRPNTELRRRLFRADVIEFLSPIQLEKFEKRSQKKKRRRSGKHKD